MGVAASRHRQGCEGGKREKRKKKEREQKSENKAQARQHEAQEQSREHETYVNTEATYFTQSEVVVEVNRSAVVERGSIIVTTY